jgi:hypothetical protein
MPNKDEFLQQMLQALEEGERLERVLDDLPEEDRELGSLLRLATAIRSVPHPEPIAEYLPEKVSIAIRQQSKSSKTYEANIIQYVKELLRGGYKRHLSVPVALVGTAFLLLFIFSAIIGISRSLVPANTAIANQVSGTVEMAAAADPSSWKPLRSGERVSDGTLLRTSGASSAALVYPDGSRTLILPNTQINLSRLDSRRGKPVQLVIHQEAGLTQHEVVPFEQHQGGLYMVYTPGGAVSVHGTKFSVEVDEFGRSHFSVDTGKLLVSNDTSDVFLHPGQATSIIGSDLLPPAYRFALQGVLEEFSGSIWTVDGVEVTVVEQTIIEEGLTRGNLVRVEGRLDKVGGWVANRITAAREAERYAWFTGVFKAAGLDSWLISDKQVLVNNRTRLDQGLEENTLVRVAFYVTDDDIWQAFSIEILEALPPPDQRLTAEPSNNSLARPNLFFIPGDLQVFVCPKDSNFYDLTAVLANAGEDAQDFATGVKMDYQIISGAEYVDDIDLLPAGWERVGAGENVPFAVRIRTNSDWSSAPELTDIRVRVFVGSEINQSENNAGLVTFILVSTCQDTPTPTVSPTATLTPSVTQISTVRPSQTETPVIAGPLVTPGVPTSTTGVPTTPGVPATTGVPTTPQVPTTTGIPTTPRVPTTTGVPTSTIIPTATSVPTSTQDPGQIGDCPGTQIHPTGRRLADKFGVPYAEIMSWFCEGFGFGEIETAYDLSKITGEPAATYFAWNRAGMGWGDIIKKALEGANPSSPTATPIAANEPDNPGKPSDPGKPKDPGKPDKPNK